MRRSNPSGPRQSDGGRRIGGDSFAASGEAELFAGGRFHGDTIDGDAGNARDRLTHGVAVRADLRRLADDGEIKMRDAAAALRDAVAGEFEEAIGSRAFPLRIARREMRTDIAIGQRAEQGVGEGMQTDIGVGVAGQCLTVRNLETAEPDMIAGAERMDVDAGAG